MDPQTRATNEPFTDLPPPTSQAQSLPPAVDPLPSSAGLSPNVGVSVMTPELANDSDNIENEWVARAKGILFQTRGDPYAQNQQMARFKADYMKKRYNKDLIITET